MLDHGNEMSIPVCTVPLILQFEYDFGANTGTHWESGQGGLLIRWYITSTKSSTTTWPERDQTNGARTAPWGKKRFVESFRNRLVMSSCRWRQSCCHICHCIMLKLAVSWAHADPNLLVIWLAWNSQFRMRGWLRTSNTGNWWAFLMLHGRLDGQAALRSCWLVVVALGHSGWSSHGRW